MSRAKTIGVTVGVLATAAIAINQMFVVASGESTVTDLRGFDPALVLLAPDVVAATHYLFRD